MTHRMLAVIIAGSAAACGDSTGPGPVPADLAAKSVALGLQHACALLQSGGVVCWGEDALGQVGDGHQECTPDEFGRCLKEPVQILDSGFVSIAAGAHATCALHESETVFCWGASQFGAVGEAPRTCETQAGSLVLPCAPEPSGVLNRPFTELVGGGSRSLSASTFCGRSDSLFVCWGYRGSGIDGSRGQRGRIRTLYAEEPLERLSLGFDDTGGVASCAISVASALYCWGRNDVGQMGILGVQFSTLPLLVRTTIAWKTIAAGGDHTCGISVDERTFCWGNNAVGELGDSTQIDRERPFLVVGEAGLSDLALGRRHSCGLDATGRAYCWGRFSGGSPGEGPLIPTPVGVSIQFVQLVAREDRTCGVDTIGRVFCWGTATEFSSVFGGDVSRVTVPRRVLLGSEVPEV